MTPTEARVATLRALADWTEWKASTTDIRTAALAEIAAIEAEKAAPLDKAPTEARPTHVRVMRVCSVHKTMWTVGKVYPVEHWFDGSPTCRDNEGAVSTMRVTEWEPAPTSESPAPPPARPKRVKVISSGSYGHLVTTGKVYVVKYWAVGGTLPVVVSEDGDDVYLSSNIKWVPADEPDGEEARYSEVVRVAQNLVDSYGRLRSWDETTCADVNELRKALARAKVKS